MCTKSQEIILSETPHYYICQTYIFVYFTLFHLHKQCSPPLNNGNKLKQPIEWIGNDN